MHRYALPATVVASYKTASVPRLWWEGANRREMPTGESSHPQNTAQERSGEAPEATRIRLLGGFEVSVDARTIEDSSWRLRKAAGLVKLLALAPGHRLHRERVMDLLWPHLGTKAASNNLRGALHAARRTLNPSTTSRYLVLRGEQLVLCPAGRLRVDAEAFEEAASAARRSQNPAAFRAAIGLYGGELLPEDRHEAWTQDKREGLRRTYLSLLVELAGLYGERPELAKEALGRAVAEEPTYEQAHAALMRLYALSGRPERALAQYGRLHEALSGESSKQPGAAVRRLRDEIASGKHGPAPSAAPPSPSAGGHNLPVPKTSFVGRERELLEVGRLLDAARLLTLTGAGGSGKTRLALEVARGAGRAYPGGVWLVRLAPLSDPELVAQAVVETLGIDEQPGRPLPETLAEALNSRGKTLLLLDNCEHLVDATARLVEALLGSCPGLSILATSREALLVAGETNWPVPPLALPETGLGAHSLRSLHECESARLFAERATHRSPAFALAGPNARAVADICRRLDGIPLAIELAAARTGTLSVKQISARLSDSLQLLTGGSVTTSSRHQTLRGTLDWSHELLEEPEKKLFARLSVFAGGWTLEAAEAVGAEDEGIEEGDVLDVISRLTDKSLVMVGATASGAARYRMLEPIRQYAGERLREYGEANDARGRHAAYFLALAEEAEPMLAGPQQGPWVKRLEDEHDNLRAALSRVLEREKVELGLRFCGALWRFWFARGYVGEGIRWLGRTLVGGGSAPARVKALEGQGWLGQFQGDFGLAETTYEEMLGLSRDLDDDRNTATALNSLATIAAQRGDPERARSLLEENLSMLKKLGGESDDPYKLTKHHALALLGYLAANEHDYARATALWEESLALAREVGDPFRAGQILSNLGYTALLQDDYERATALCEEALSLGHKLGGIGEDIMSESRVNLGLAALARGDHERAKVSFAKALVTSEKLGKKLTIINSLEGMAGLAGALGEDTRAARLQGAAEAAREATGIVLPPAERALHESHLGAARSRLGTEWRGPRDEGRTMSLEAATRYALSEDAAQQRDAVPSAYEPTSNLSRREREVAVLVARGLTNRQISTRLGISERTAGNHVASILRKLDLSSRAQVAIRSQGDRPPPSEHD
jgi:predicted ATPase/DNA-binding SARP family transcriptional activator/DNA-binding CsgD family transcriptional regulator